MGVSCSHENKEWVEKISEHTTNYLWRVEIWNVKCKDCLKEFRTEKKIGRITGVEYSSAEVDKQSCKHTEFEVDQTTKEVCHEKTTIGIGLRFLMGAAMDGIQYRSFYVAIAQCKRCSAKFKVRAGFEKNGEIVEEIGIWTPLLKNVETIHKTYRKEIEYID